MNNKFIIQLLLCKRFFSNGGFTNIVRIIHKTGIKKMQKFSANFNNPVNGK